MAWNSQLPAGDQLWKSGHQHKIFSHIGDQESAISDPAKGTERTPQAALVHMICNFFHHSSDIANTNYSGTIAKGGGVWKEIDKQQFNF